MTTATSAAATTVAQIVADLGALRLRPAALDEVPAAHQLCAELIGDKIVDAGTLRAVHQQTGGALFLAHERRRLTGLLAIILLSQAGEAAVRREAFDALRPQRDHLAAEGEPPHGLYAWGVAARTRATAQRLIAGAHRIGRGAAARIPSYARPATSAGARLMRERLGFVDLPGSCSGLVWAPPFAGRAVAA